jgi:hypothetical protein
VTGLVSGDLLKVHFKTVKGTSFLATMDSAQSIPLPSFGSSTSSSYAVPKLRVSRWTTNGQHESTASASGSTTVPVHSRDGNGLSEGERAVENSENENERLGRYPLSSDGEAVASAEEQPERPAQRLRNIMDQMRSQPFMSNGHFSSTNGSPPRAVSPLPSVRDSDLESISPSVIAGSSAKDRLRNTWSQAMIPPVGNTPQKSKSRVMARRKSTEGLQGSSVAVQGGPRKSLSDEEVSCEWS